MTNTNTNTNIAFVNGAFHKCYVGKHGIYVHVQKVKGLHSWITVEELEKMGCKVVIRSGRH